MKKTVLSQNVTAKFGGTSLATAAQCLKVKDIILSSLQRKYIVVSAPGKAYPNDAKITDMLIGIYNNIKAGKDWKGLWAKAVSRYSDIISELGLTISLEGMSIVLENEIISNPCYDYIVSRGEYLQARVMTALLNASGCKATFIDTAECIFFSASGVIDYNKTCKSIRKKCTLDSVFVFPGFYGTDIDGRVRVFSRGGSDITGALVACALDTAVYENWTDVSGFYTVNPSDVPNACPIKEMTYQEARALSYAGATVLHQETVPYLVKKGISVNVRNTNVPNDLGTTIVNNRSEKRDVIGIAGKKNFAVFTIEKMMMNDEVGFGRRLLSIFETANIPYDHQVTGIDTISLIIDKTKIPDYAPLIENNCLEKLTAIINSNVKPDKITVLDNVAAITIVAQNISNDISLLSKLCLAYESNNIPVYIISQEMTGQMISVVDVEHLSYALNSLHKAFFEG